MVREAPRPSLREASCCRVEVIDILLDGFRRGAGLRLVAEVEFVEPLAVEMGEAGNDALARGGGELDLDRPVFLRLEGFDLGFPFADDAQRDRLDAPGRTAARQLTP